MWLLIGVLAALWTISDFRDTSIASEVTAMNLARLESKGPRTKGLSATVDAGAIELATQRLMTPWSRLLEDLELAATDSDNNVALLEISPDMNKRSVRVSGEARTLPHVLDYVSRLQTAESLRYPLLENHEIQVSDRERPVRFVVLADWRLPQ
jgi:hypothetical protein